jgi:hypothetical protein
LTLTIILDIKEHRFQLLVTAEVVPTSPILGTLMMEAIRSSEMSVVAKIHMV